MHSEEEKGLIVAKLDDGEDLFHSLLEVCRRHSVHSGLVVSGIGMLIDAEVAYFDGIEYRTEKFDEAMELIALHGTIAVGIESPIHLHCALADSSHNVRGGHLMSGMVKVLAEIVIIRLDELELRRDLNPESDLRELAVVRSDRLGD